MVEYSFGYMRNNRQAALALDDALSPTASAVNRALFAHFEKTATQRTNAAQQEQEPEEQHEAA